MIPGNSPEPESHIIAIPDDSTNNEAEYLGVIEALKYIRDHTLTNLDLNPWIVLSDSKLVIMQSARQWKCRAENLQHHLNMVWYYLDNLPVKVDFKWVPREENPAGVLLEEVLTFERQVDREIRDEGENGKTREYAKRLLRGLSGL